MRLARRIRFTESVRLTLIAEAFNLFNRANVETVNTAFYANANLALPAASSAFGTPRTFAAPREVQLALKFDF